MSRSHVSAAYRLVKRSLSLILSVTLLLAACAEEPDGQADASRVEPRYETTTVVAEDADGTRLCLGGVMDSLPPQCGGPDVLGWRRDAVDGEESRAGVTWGEFHVVGTFDGTTFTLSDAGPPQPRVDETGTRFAPPCPEPQEGWVDVDPSMAGESDRISLGRVVEGIPSHAGHWIGYLEQPIDYEAPGEYVVTVAFTGDPAVHEAASQGSLGRSPLPDLGGTHVRSSAANTPRTGRRRRRATGLSDDVVGHRRHAQPGRAGGGGVEPDDAGSARR